VVAEFWQAAVPIPLAAVVTDALAQRTNGVVGAGVTPVVDVRVKVTVPESKAVPAVYWGVTVAVNATGVLVDDGLGEELTETVVGSAATDCGTALEAGLLRKLFVFELVNVAVIEWLPVEVNATRQAGTTPPVNEELPALGNVQFGNAVPPSK
jgi:hypothetical protein